MKTNKISCDIVVIGGGPAGLMAAGVAAKSGLMVYLLEKMPSCGMKLLMTGSGACNITNALEFPEFLEAYHENGKFLYPAFSALSRDSLLDFFRKKGVEFVTREDGKIFPATGSSKTILESLLKFCVQEGVIIKNNTDVTGIVLNFEINKSKIQRNFLVSTNKDMFYADKIIVTTGGLSYPKTGSNGAGYKIAKYFHHEISDLRPALVGLEVPVFAKNKSLSGVSLKNIYAKLVEQDKNLKIKILNSYTGDILITHNGLSGPCALYLSRYLPNDLKEGVSIKTECKYKIAMNLRNNFTISETYSHLSKLIKENPKKNIANIISSGFNIPVSFVKFLLSEQNKITDMNSSDISKANLIKICEMLHSSEFFISQSTGFSKAMVTAGGVSLKQISPKSMESKLVKGLYFAGEVIDIDGFTGGFNLQAAFSTGYLAGLSASVN